jgi:aldehyde:ferredoxin oxidoreductase
LICDAKAGVAMSVDDVLSMGKEILHTEHDFNLAAGFTNKDDRLPEFFEHEPLPPHNVVWDFSGEEIDTFWKF